MPTISTKMNTTYHVTGSNQTIVINQGASISTEPYYLVIDFGSYSSNTVINRGTLSGAPIYLDAGFVGYNFVGGLNNVLYNDTTGVIKTILSVGSGCALYNHGTIVVEAVRYLTIGGGDLVNYGVIKSFADVSGGGHIENYGSMFGDVVSGNSWGGGAVINDGTIRGNVWIYGHSSFGGTGKVVGNVTGDLTDNVIDLSNQTVRGLISGQAGNDIITGTHGNDIINGGSGNDVLTGGGGIDTASYAGEFAGVTVNLAIHTQQDTGGSGLDTLNGFTNLTGSSYNDILTGDGNNNIIDGGAGDDILAGGGGIDTVSYADAATGVTVSLAINTAQNTGGAGIDTLSGFEKLTGSSHNDMLTGDASNNIINGGAGDDILIGGGGIDTVSYAGTATGVTVSLAIATAQDTGGAGIDTLSGFENLSGSSHNDILTGDANNNIINGGAGDDMLIGGGGIDTVRYGGAASGVTVSLAIATAQDTGGAGIDTLSGFSNLTGSSHDDTLIGDGNSNVIRGGDGDDMLDGGGGLDTLAGGAGHDSFVIDAALGAANIVRVTDFSITDDFFSLSRAIFGALPAGSSLDPSAFHLGATAQSATDRILYDSATGNIYYDADGSGSAAAHEFAHIAPGLALTASDFHIFG